MKQAAVKRLWEWEVLDRFLGEEFPGVAELAAQTRVAQVQRLMTDGVPAFIFTVPEECVRARVRSTIPVEGTGEDVDGARITVILHVREGVLAELEVFRDDGECLVALPSPDALVVDSSRGRSGD